VIIFRRRVKMRKIVLLILAIIILFSISYAQTYGGFSEGPTLGWSPRAMGMGGCFYNNRRRY
jgi:hypothetical protein